MLSFVFRLIFIIPLFKNSYSEVSDVMSREAEVFCHKFLCITGLDVR